MYTVAGLPLHPLVVHAVVVLLPLAAIGTLAVAARPVWRRALGIPVLLVALAGTVSVPLATASGQQLRVSMGGGSPLVAEHAARAGALLPVAALYVVLLAGAVLVERTALAPSGVGAMGRSPRLDRSRVATLLAGAAAAAGVVTTVLVVWIGHAGASAGWS
ncbi:MAG: hypothetical protein L0I24_23235 [Pseudonocardia sp.]|nr:hypothetical protein [Pseudonocardia sp.]